MKKKVMNIRPQEVTENGERSVQYKGSDGKFHSVAPSGGNAQSSASVSEPVFVVRPHQNETVQKLVAGELVECDKSELCNAVVNNPFTKILMVNGMWKFQLHLTEYNDQSSVHNWIYRAIFNDADASVEIRLENEVWTVTGNWSA